MKKPLLKKNSLILQVSILLLAFLSIVVYSCRKEIDKNGKSAAPILAQHSVDIAKLKSAYNKGINNHGNLKINDVSQQTIDKIISNLTVDWTSYSLYTYPDSLQVIEFVMPDDSTLLIPGQLTLHDSLKYHSKTTAVFILRKDTINMSFFMKTVEKATAPGYQPVLNQVRYQQIPNTFSGNVLYFTFDRQFINGYKWDSGQITKTLSLNSAAVQNTKQVNSSSKLKTNTVVADCETVTYELYSYTYGNGVLTNTEDIGTIEVETCDYYDTGNGGGVAGGSAPPTTPCTTPPINVESVNGKLHVNYVQPPTGGGGSGGTTPCPPTPPTVVVTFTNNVNNKCLHIMVDATIISGISTQINSLIKSVFKGDADPALTFTDVSNLANTRDAQTTSGFASDGSLVIANIALNANILPNASKEYIAVSIMHETLHAYYASINGGNSELDHEAMAISYVNQMAASLVKMFPTLNPEDAKALAYGGLEGTETYNWKIADFGLSSNYQAINASYRNDSKGHGCN